jgi:hypothetical protein
MNTFEFLRPIAIKEKIRLGPKKDGGYVVYDRILKDTTVLLTYGVGWEVGFEEHFNEVTGSKVLMFDPTMFGKYILDVKRLKKLYLKGEIRDSYKYLRFVLRMWNDLRQLRKQQIFFINEGIASTKGEKYDTFKNHLKRYHLINQQILLKMDIEGYEYQIFEDADIYQQLNGVNQIIIEFHDLHRLFFRFKAIVEKLKLDFEIIHVHGNNCGGQFYFNDPARDERIPVPKVLELTFVKKGKILVKDIVNEKIVYPIEGLDYPNRPKFNDLMLKFI